MSEVEKYLCCVGCRGALKRIDAKYRCIECHRSYPFVDNIFDCLNDIKEEKLLSKDKWDEFYENWYKELKPIDEFYKVKDNYDKCIIKQIEKHSPLTKDHVFLELGCGSFFVGSLLSKECKVVIGIDFSLPALMSAKKILDEMKIENYILIRGDIFNIPLKDKSIDVLYGGGVIEHFKDTLACIKEFSRIMKIGGVAINSVPMLNIGSLTYRQLWGNIPDFPVLKQLAEFVHIKLLGAKHMYFGYELSFTRGKMKYLHELGGFKKIQFFRLESDVMLGFMPEMFRPFFRKIAERSSLFWPMMLVVAKK